MPRSAIMITRSRELSLKLAYDLTHKTMICRSKCRPLNRSSIGTNRCNSSSSPATLAFAPEPPAKPHPLTLPDTPALKLQHFPPPSAARSVTAHAQFRLGRDGRSSGYNLRRRSENQFRNVAGWASGTAGRREAWTARSRTARILINSFIAIEVGVRPRCGVSVHDKRQ